jgi:hypothetical protein
MRKLPAAFRADAAVPAYAAAVEQAVRGELGKNETEEISKRNWRRKGALWFADKVPIIRRTSTLCADWLSAGRSWGDIASLEAFVFCPNLRTMCLPHCRYYGPFDGGP